MFLAACSDSGNAEQSKLDAGKEDAPPMGLDLPAKLDLDLVAQPDLPNDLPFSPELPTQPVDVPPVDYHPGPDLDGPVIRLDGPEWDAPGLPAVDGPPGPTDAEIKTLYSPDGRIWTVTMVDACRNGGPPDSKTCPATYQEGLAKVLAVDAGAFMAQTKAGRCREGSYVYFPYFSTSSLACYYDASSQQLIASAQYNDTISECGQDGTASYAFVRGAYPTCTNVTWEANK
jgi:hypothetical protein